MFKMGDFVVYRQLQVCKIDGIETPSFEGDKSKQYYKLFPAFLDKSDTVIYVPVASLDSLRPLFTSEEVESAFAAIDKIKPTVSIAKKPAQQAAYYQEILSSHSLLRYFSLLKEIALKEKSSTKKLSEIDNRFRTKTERLLCDELALVLNKTPEEIKEKLTAIL